MIIVTIQNGSDSPLVFIGEDRDTINRAEGVLRRLLGETPGVCHIQRLVVTDRFGNRLPELSTYLQDITVEHVKVGPRPKASG